MDIVSPWSQEKPGSPESPWGSEAGAQGGPLYWDKPDPVGKEESPNCILPFQKTPTLGSRINPCISCAVAAFQAALYHSSGAYSCVCSPQGPENKA